MMRARAKAKATLDVSMVIQRRPHCSATVAVVPDPQVAFRGLFYIPKLRLSNEGADMTKYGYARVSSDTQDYQSQVEALKAAGCKKIYTEKASGRSTNGRPELAKVMKALQPGDAWW